MRDVALELDQVVCRVGPRRRVTAVDGVSLAVPRGQVMALMGNNGAGKTTLLDLVCGLQRPTSGTVTVLGTSAAAAARSGRVVAVLQTGGLLRDLTAAETVRLIASLHGRDEPVTEALERAGLARVADRRVGALSGGEQQRVKFAVALVTQPELLVLDEPTAGMDLAGRRQFWAEVARLRAEGATVIHSTHHADEVDGVADRVVVLSAGKVVADAGVGDLRRASPTRRLRAVGVDETVPAAESDARARALLSAGATGLVVEEPSLDEALAALGVDR